MDWIEQACDTDKWCDVVKKAVRVQVELNVENFGTR